MWLTQKMQLAENARFEYLHNKLMDSRRKDIILARSVAETTMGLYHHQFAIKGLKFSSFHAASKRIQCDFILGNLPSNTFVINNGNNIADQWNALSKKELDKKLNYFSQTMPIISDEIRERCLVIGLWTVMILLVAFFVFADKIV